MHVDNSWYQKISICPVSVFDTFLMILMRGVAPRLCGPHRPGLDPPSCIEEENEIFSAGLESKVSVDAGLKL